MWAAIRRKFLQNHEIKIKLLETEGRVIVEHTVNDHYWADGGDGSGKNRLGILLMKLRAELRTQYNNFHWILPPWIAFPDVDQLDMFWRMGLGENYMYNWIKWFDRQSEEVQSEYEVSYPSNENWAGFYE